MNVVFFGGGETAATALRAVSAAHSIRLVVSPPPRPAGRKLRPMPPPAFRAAAELGLPTAHRVATETLRQCEPAAMVVCDYGALLPADWLDIAPLGALNIHPSLLPRWRGAAPIERAILAGDECAGATVMRLNATLDGGDILAQWRAPIAPATTGGELRKLLARQGTALLLRTLARPAEFPPQPQDETKATMAPKIAAADRELNFAEAAVVCWRRIRAFAPAPGGWCFFAGERLKALAGEIVAERAACPGVLLAADNESGIVIGCGEGALRLTVVQRAGRKAMPAGEFLRGFRANDWIGKRIDRQNEWRAAKNG